MEHYSYVLNSFKLFSKNTTKLWETCRNIVIGNKENNFKLKENCTFFFFFFTFYNRILKSVCLHLAHLLKQFVDVQLQVGLKRILESFE